MNGKKRSSALAKKRRIARLTRELSRVETQMAWLRAVSGHVDAADLPGRRLAKDDIRLCGNGRASRQDDENVPRFDHLVERRVVLFAPMRSKHMH